MRGGGARRLPLLLGFFAAFLGGASAEDWPRLRGPEGSGHSQATGLPVTWSETENVRYKVPVPGRGYSGPVVLGDQVWLTTAHDEDRRLHALCFDRASGELVHDIELFRPEAWQASHLENSYASPTPVIEKGRVYAHFGAYGTAAIDTRNGQVVWTNEELVIDHEVGPGSSPILYRDLMIVNLDGYDQRYVVALDKNTGQVRWRADRSVEIERKGTQKKAFSTPILVEHEGRTELISAGAGQVSAYVPESGLEVWRVRYDGYSNVPLPVAGLGMVFVDTGYIKPHLYAIHLGGRGDVTDSHVAWRYHWQVPANPSPLLIGERLYMVSDWGIASWLDARRGEDLWRQRLGGKYYAAPIYADGRIYNFSVQGKSVVIAPGETYQELAVNQLDGEIRATPAVAGKAFFIRTKTHLYRIEEDAGG